MHHRHPSSSLMTILLVTSCYFLLVEHVQSNPHRMTETSMSNRPPLDTTPPPQPVSLRGIPPDVVVALAAGSRLTCNDGTLTLPLSVINDNYCDCLLDGADEPGTSACSHVSFKPRFYCLNRDFEPHWLHTSHVNDGICDCCDGSDEYEEEEEEGIAPSSPPAVICPMTCAHLAEKAATAALAHQKMVTAGNAQRLVAVALAKTEMLAMTVERDAVILRLAEAKATLTQLKTILASEKAQEVIDAAAFNAAAQQHLLVSLGLLDLSTSDLHALIMAMATQLAPTEVMQHITTVRASTCTREGDTSPACSIMAVFTQQQSYEETVQRQHEQAESDDEGQDLDEVDQQEKDLVEADLPDEDAMEKEETQDGIKTPGPGPVIESQSPLEVLFAPSEPRSEYVRQEVTVAQQHVTDATISMGDVSTHLTSLNGTLNGSYGPDNALWSYRPTCVDATLSGYHYHVCLFGEATQDKTSLGQATTLTRPPMTTAAAAAAAPWQLVFQKGAKCWNGPKRSLTVTLMCGPTLALREMEEPETCVYTAIATVPLLCNTLTLSPPRTTTNTTNTTTFTPQHPQDQDQDQDPASSREEL